MLFSQSKQGKLQNMRKKKKKVKWANIPKYHTTDNKKFYTLLNPKQKINSINKKVSQTNDQPKQTTWLNQNFIYLLN